MTLKIPEAKKILHAARFIYQCDEIQVPLPGSAAEQEKCLARNLDGAWAKAWVYVPYDGVDINQESA